MAAANLISAAKSSGDGTSFFEARLYAKRRLASVAEGTVVWSGSPPLLPSVRRLVVMATRRYYEDMETTKRATVYFDPEIHRALRLKAAATERSVSDLVNEAVGLALGEDAEDLEIFEQRRGGPLLSFDEVVKDLRRRGRI